MQTLRNELTFHLAAEAAQIGFWERDLITGQITHCTVTAAILGWEADRLSCSTHEVDEIIVPSDLPLIGERLQADIASGQPFDMEFRIRRPNKELRWIAVRAVGVHDHSGQVVKVSGVMFDITDRKLTESAMRDTEIRYQLATQAARIGTWEQEDFTGDTHISPMAAQVLGLPPDKTLLRRDEWIAMMLPEDLPKTVALREQSGLAGPSF